MVQAYVPLSQAISGHITDAETHTWEEQPLTLVFLRVPRTHDIGSKPKRTQTATALLFTLYFFAKRIHNFANTQIQVTKSHSKI